MTDYKQVILVRQDLKLPKGKLSAQVGHASVENVLKSDPKKIIAWREQGMPKIVLKVKDLNELREYERLTRKDKLTCSVITDAGRTTVKPGTVTCMAIGPDEEKKIDAITSKLGLL